MELVGADLDFLEQKALDLLLSSNDSSSYDNNSVIALLFFFSLLPFMLSVFIYEFHSFIHSVKNFSVTTIMIVNCEMIVLIDHYL